jgi:hypothetical protein
VPPGPALGQGGFDFVPVREHPVVSGAHGPRSPCGPQARHCRVAGVRACVDRASSGPPTTRWSPRLGCGRKGRRRCTSGGPGAMPRRRQLQRGRGRGTASTCGLCRGCGRPALQGPSRLRRPGACPRRRPGRRCSWGRGRCGIPLPGRRPGASRLSGRGTGGRAVRPRPGSRPSSPGLPGTARGRGRKERQHLTPLPVRSEQPRGARPAALPEVAEQFVDGLRAVTGISPHRVTVPDDTAGGAARQYRLSHPCSLDVGSRRRSRPRAQPVKRRHASHLHG